jgi:hypothetical protein
MPSPHFHRLGLPAHAVASLATLVVSLGSLGLMLTAFDQASPQRWAAGSPDLEQGLARCQALRERTARDACGRELAVAALQGQRPVLLLAGR